MTAVEKFSLQVTVLKKRVFEGKAKREMEKNVCPSYIIS